MRMIEQINAEQAAAIRAAAEKGDAKAQERLGDLCRFGEGVRRNVDEAETWYKKASDQGNWDALAKLAWLYELSRKEVKPSARAVEGLYHKSAEHGSLLGMERLADMYLKGRGVNGTRADAITWYRKAADAGSMHGMFWLGLMYENGIEVEQDYAEAAKWCRRPGFPAVWVAFPGHAGPSFTAKGSSFRSFDHNGITRS